MKSFFLSKSMYVVYGKIGGLPKKSKIRCEIFSWTKNLCKSVDTPVLSFLDREMCMILCGFTTDGWIFELPHEAEKPYRTFLSIKKNKIVKWL